MSNTRAWLLSACSLSLLVTVGCAEESGETVDPGMDAGADASAPDAALRDAGMDANVPDASRLDGTAGDASSTCYSPFRLPSRPTQLRSPEPERGCACEENATSHAGYCIESFALVCDEQRWKAVLDGPCFPTPAPSADSCAARAGAITSDDRCPSGFHRKPGGPRTAADGGIERSCCIPIEVSSGECTAAGLRVVARDVGTGLLSTTCAGGGALRAFIRGSASSVCCE